MHDKHITYVTRVFDSFKQLFQKLYCKFFSCVWVIVAADGSSWWNWGALAEVGHAGC